MEITDELLRLEDAVDKPVAVGIAEYSNRRVSYDINCHKLKLCNFSFVFVQFAKSSRRMPDLRPVLDKRQKKIARRSALDPVFRARRQYAAAAKPGLVIFLHRKNTRACLVRVDFRMIRMLELRKRAASIYHLLLKPLYFLLEELVRIAASVAVFNLGLRVYAFDDIHRRLACLLVGRLRYQLDVSEVADVVYKFSHFQILSFEFKMYLLESLNIFIKNI